MNEVMKYRNQNEHIHLNGYDGTWYVIDASMHGGRFVYLLESEQFGDEVASIIVDNFNNVIMDDVYNGFADLMYA